MDYLNKLGIGPKRLTVGAGYGMRDWLMQRVSAALMLIFVLVVIVSYLFSSATGYFWWAGLIANPFMQALAFATALALIWHAWVGMRDIWMDYVKSAGLRLALHCLTIVWMLGCLAYAVRAVWRV